jgi:osmoprotectant transport system permease protein
MNLKKGLNLLLVLLLSLSLAACGGANEGGEAGGEKATITISGKNFTEQDILAHMMASLIEAKTDIEVIRKPFLGGTQVVHSALINGDVDLYAEYTGTGWTATLKQETINQPQETYDKVKAAYEEQFNVTWLQPFGFNNTYTLAMREDHAKELGIETYSDLAKQSPNLVLGSTQEFLERPDGYKGLQEVYGMDFKDTKGMDPGLTYSAVKEGAVDVNDAFATDGRIPAFNLKVLKDDKQFFPPYYAAPVIRMDTLEAHPELEEVLNLLAGKLNDESMAQLNAQVDIDGKKAQTVAENWLKEQGLID